MCSLAKRLFVVAMVVSALALSFQGRTVASTTVYTVPNDKAQLRYAMVLRELRDYQKAIKELERLIASYPLSPLKMDAQFYLADTLFLKGDYTEAALQFAQFLENWPASKFQRLAEKRLQAIELLTEPQRWLAHLPKKRPPYYDYLSSLPRKRLPSSYIYALPEKRFPELYWAMSLPPKRRPFYDYMAALPQKRQPSYPYTAYLPERRSPSVDYYMTGLPQRRHPSGEFYLASLPSKRMPSTDVFELPPRRSPSFKPSMFAEKEPRDGITTTRPLKAVQVMLFSGRTLEDVEGEIKRLKTHGIDTIILRVFHNRGDRFYPFVRPARHTPRAGVYFRTSHAPVVADILTPILEMAHREGIRVFAWMTTRYANYGIEHIGELACRGYDVRKERYFRCRGLDLFNDTVVEHIKALYRDLAKYPIDGILFQDDLILKYNEGLTPVAMRRFKEETGLELEPSRLYRIREDSIITYTPLFWQWATWKNNRIIHIIDELKRTVRELNPDVKFAINLMYENLTSPSNALAWFSQDIEKVAQKGFDYYAIMAYQKQISDELRKDMAEVEKLILKMTDRAKRIVGVPDKILIKLQTIDWKTGRPLAERDIIKLAKKVKKMGVSVAVVPYRYDFPYAELAGSHDN